MPYSAIRRAAVGLQRFGAGMFPPNDSLIEREKSLQDMLTISRGLRATAMATLAFGSATQSFAQSTVTPPALMYVG